MTPGILFQHLSGYFEQKNMTEYHDNEGEEAGEI
jgi:hypothetical protein